MVSDLSGSHDRSDETIEVTVSDKQVHMTCEVVWITSQHTALGDTQRMGVKFTSLSEPGYKVIKQFYSKFKTQDDLGEFTQMER